jgi:LPXTG-motif cell wall-anchored protein
MILALFPRVDARGEGEVIEEATSGVVVEGEGEPVVAAAAPTMWTTTADGTPKYDFAPGETVYIHGADFAPAITLEVVVTRPDGTIVTGDGTFSCSNCWDSVGTDAAGGFVYPYILNGIEGLYGVAAYASPWAGEPALATTTFTDSAPAQIRSDTHEGQQKPAGTWTTGNTTEFVEGDWVNFRFHLTADDAISGQMSVRYSLEDAGCHFFESPFTFGNKSYGSGAIGSVIVPDSGTTATLTITKDGSTAIGSEWVQNLDLATDGAGGWTFYYHLYLTENVHGCTGSSQHSRLDFGPNPGAYKQTGMKNVPVPASAVIRLPDITVIKQIDRDGDGTFESVATAGEYQFDLSPNPTSILSGEPLVTDGSGTVFFENVVPDGSYGIGESQLIIGGEGVHDFVGLAPTGNENCALVGGVVTATIAAGDLQTVENATCVVQNRAMTGTLEVVKDLVPGTDTGTFDLSIDSTVHAAGVGDGGTTGPQTVYQGDHTVGEAGAGGTLLSDYASTIACVDAAGAPVAATGSGPWTVEVLDGQDVVCTITNTRTSSIKIVKDAIGIHAGSAEFDYTTTGGLGSFTLGDGESETFTGLLPGAYTVTEGAESGWYLSDLTCTGASDATVNSATATINLAAGENVTCEYENTELGKIIVEKNAIGVNDDTAVFDYTTTGLSDFTLMDGGTKQFDGLVPGPYGITEKPEAGWELIGLTCSSGDVDLSTGEADLVLAAGQVITCTYTNRELGSLTIEKIAIGVDAASADFDYTTSSNLSAFSLGNGESKTFDGLSAGTYMVTETIPSGWAFTSLVCTGTTSPVIAGASATVNLAAGEHATCTYTNTQRGSITVIKDATGVGAATAEFDYTTTNLSPAAFTLGDGDSTTYDGLLPGTYGVAETAESGWTLTGIVCSGLATPATTSVAAGTASLNLAAGEDAVCTFTNRQKGTITIVKQTLPDGDAAIFTFDASYQGPSINLSDGQSDTSAMLEPGTYTVGETVPAGWDLTGLTCSGTSTAATIDLAGASASIPLAAGESAECTFTNTKRGSITIVKEDVSAFDNPGDGDDFAFTGDLGAFTLDDPDADDGDAYGDTKLVTGLVPGTYTVTETITPDADPLDLDGPWSLDSIVCTGADVSTVGLGVTITLDPGENAVCTFRNEQEEIILPPFLLGDFVWNDANDNGLQDAGEKGMAGISVALLDAGSSTVLATTTTNSAGLYSFSIAVPGKYVVRFTTPASYDITDGLVGTNTAIDSNLLPTGLTPEIDVTVAKMLGVGSDLTIDAGFVFIEPPDIPETGTETDRMAGLAGALLLGGFLLLVMSRRRRTES